MSYIVLPKWAVMVQLGCFGYKSMASLEDLPLYHQVLFVLFYDTEMQDQCPIELWKESKQSKNINNKLYFRPTTVRSQQCYWGNIKQNTSAMRLLHCNIKRFVELHKTHVSLRQVKIAILKIILKLNTYLLVTVYLIRSLLYLFSGGARPRPA